MVSTARYPVHLRSGQMMQEETERRSAARLKKEVKKVIAYIPIVRSPDLFSVDSTLVYHMAKMTKTARKKETSCCPEEQSTDVEMQKETEDAKKTRERRALMFALSEDSEVEEAEVLTPRHRQNKGTEADAKARSTQHPREVLESARKMQRRNALSSTSASQSRGRSASRSVSKENRRRFSRPKSKVKTKTNKPKVGSVSSPDLSSSSDEAEGNQVARPKHMLKPRKFPSEIVGRSALLVLFGNPEHTSVTLFRYGSAVPSNVVWHNYHIDICLLIFATFQRILNFFACFRRKLA